LPDTALERLRAFSTVGSRTEEYAFNLTDGPKSFSAQLTVRYVTDVLWPTGMRLTLSSQLIYSEGKLL